VYVGEEQADHDPDLVYLPDSHQITGSLTGANALENSLMLLQESLESAAALAQFEVSIKWLYKLFCIFLSRLKSENHIF
jgi:hypothetical protein